MGFSLVHYCYPDTICSMDMEKLDTKAYITVLSDW